MMNLVHRCTGLSTQRYDDERRLAVSIRQAYIVSYAERGAWGCIIYVLEIGADSLTAHSSLYYY